MEIELSSFKHGYGLQELMTDGENNYWNTDDSLPHFVRITFPAFTYVDSVELGLSYEADDSYTPEVIQLYAEGSTQDYKFFEPDGPVFLQVRRRVFEIILTIHSNHAEGKDSHVRSLRVFKDREHDIPLLPGCVL